MAHILFSRFVYPRYDLQQERQDGQIRLSIFLTAAECGGLPALVWALRVLYGHHKSGGRISLFVILLLYTDLLQLLLNPYIVTKLLQDDYCWETSTTCWTFTSLWSGSVICGLHLQQVVALEGALSSRHPHCSARAFFNSCSIITSIIVFICFFLCEFFMETLLVFFILPLPLIITLISCIITCRAPPQISDFPSRTKKPSYTVLAFVTSTVILYGTFTSTCVIMYIFDSWGLKKFSWYVFVMGVCLMSLNVIVDPLLCVIICKRHTELNKSEVKI